MDTPQFLFKIIRFRDLELTRDSSSKNDQQSYKWNNRCETSILIINNLYYKLSL
jgi:hypothetical protein